jgi:hypothetical protein
MAAIPPQAPVPVADSTCDGVDRKHKLDAEALPYFTGQGAVPVQQNGVAAMPVWSSAPPFPLYSEHCGHCSQAYL